MIDAKFVNKIGVCIKDRPIEDWIKFLGDSYSVDEIKIIKAKIHSKEV